MQKYDYIIIGAGCSGLSLVHYMLKYEQLRQKKILLIDKNIKKENDRTWCFWEAQKGEFESLICKKWDYLLFQSQYFKKTLEINPYQYKMLQAIDFYHFIQQEIAEFPNISFVQANFEEIQEVNNVVSVKTDKGTFYAEKIFNSASNFNIYNQETKSIIQHFKGWVIQTSENYFNENEATFMDFAIPQESETRFVYVLPTQKNTALIEYTVFSNEIITSDEYDKLLKYYINNHLKIENYTILHTEMGAIPMSNYAYHQHQSENIINIGTAGGQVKPSTGFAFQRIQKKMKLISEQLANDEKISLDSLKANPKYVFFDTLLLNIMLKKRLSSDIIFSELFKNNPPQRILAFLDEETNYWEDLKVMQSVPSLPFIAAIFDEIGLKLKN